MGRWGHVSGVRCNDNELSHAFPQPIISHAQIPKASAQGEKLGVEGESEARRACGIEREEYARQFTELILKELVKETDYCKCRSIPLFLMG